jgi:WD40 repeat protein
MSGVCVYKVAAHSELVTSVRFLDGPNGILRIVSTSSDGSIFVWRVDPEITKKMVQRSKDRNDRLKQTKPETTTDAASLRATTPTSPQALKQAAPRLRRTSAVPPSQFSNQNVRTERKSFSHVSKSENKYDDLYKKLEKTPPPRIQTDTPQSPVLAARLKGRVSSPSPRDANSKGMSSSVSTPRLITAEAGVQNTQWRGNFMPRKVFNNGDIVESIECGIHVINLIEGI